MKHVITMCGQNVVSLNITEGDTYSYQRAIKG
jgi:hypothetical protein